MDDGQEAETNDKTPFYGDHRFLVMIILSVIVANILIVVSLFLYRQSGAAQLDLSRPGYKDVRAKIVSKDDSFSNFSASGAMNIATLDSFQLLFSQQTEKAKAVDAFGGDPLNPEVLWPINNILTQ